MRRPLGPVPGPLLGRVAPAGRRPTTRRGLLRGSAALAGGGALALAFAGAPGLSARRLAAAQDNGDTGPFEDETEVLNFALSLEYLDSTLYRSGLEEFDEATFVDAGFDASVREYLAQITENELTQVEFLGNTISDLGGEPVGPGEYEFPYTDVVSFLALSQQVEEVGLDAYTGAAQFLIGNDDLLTAALTIHGVEARHLSYFRLLNGALPFPEAFEAPLTPDEVLAAVQPFVVGGLTLEQATGRDLDEDS